VTAKPIFQVEGTGQAAFDTILGGGIPTHSVTVIAGESGSGKTILTLQILFHAARAGKKCLYFTTLSEPAAKVIRYMQSFDFFDVDLLDQHIQFIDLGEAIRKGADATLTEVVSRVEQSSPSLVAIDSFRAIGELVQPAGTQRPFVYDLANQMAGWGATTLLVGEYTSSDFSRFAEFAVADGIIRLGARRQELTSLREIEILKLRGAHYVSGVHFVEINASGLAVYARVRAPEPSEREAGVEDRISTGVAGLDALLGGGLPRGSSTVVQGGTGIGKTVLALNFLVEGARRRERGVLFTHEETPAQLRSIAQGLEWDLEAFEQEGLLAIHYTSPVELSTDRFLNEARSQVETYGARRVVFDSLTTMALGVPSDRRFKELVYSIAKYMRSGGVSLLMTMEAEQLLGAANLSGLGVSFLADNLIQLRYLELDGRLDRAMSVIKARGIKADSELRSVTIGPGGMTVTDRTFKDMRGVLTGLPLSK